MEIIKRIKSEKGGEWEKASIWEKIGWMEEYQSRVSAIRREVAEIVDKGVK